MNPQAHSVVGKPMENGQNVSGYSIVGLVENIAPETNKRPIDRVILTISPPPPTSVCLVPGRRTARACPKTRLTLASGFCVA